VTQHVDLVENHWLTGVQTLHERIAPDDPKAKWRGDYLFATEPHTDEDCPFRDATSLLMKSVAISAREEPK
jgi:hypothetical protein